MLRKRNHRLLDSAIKLVSSVAFEDIFVVRLLRCIVRKETKQNALLYGSTSGELQYEDERALCVCVRSRFAARNTQRVLAV